MPIYASQQRTKTVSEVVNIALDFQDYLDDDELLSGTPTAVEVTSSDLTISSVARNSTSTTINRRAVGANEAVTCRVSGGVAGTDYVIRITCGTDASVPQTRICSVRLSVEAD